MFSWSPSDYTRFDRERTLPAIDLVSRLSGLRPRSVIDIGCGPGNSTEVLRRAFPDADILGIDSSPEMVSQARERLPDVTFEVMDARGIPGGYDLIFSNSCIQWIDDHDTLIPWLMGRLEKHGTLAVQIPMNDTEPVSIICEEVASLPVWHYPEGKPRRHGTLSPDDYYRILAGCSDSFEMWTTTYYHALKSHVELVEWKSGTHLRPYLDALDESEGNRLKNEILQRLEAAYKPASDGRILMRYERFFFTASR